MNGDACACFILNEPLHKGHIFLFNKVRAQLRSQGYKNPLILIHSNDGAELNGEFKLQTRMQQYEAVFNSGDLNPLSTILAIFPMPRYFGGPTEVLQHCQSRSYSGISHFIVTRDQCGIQHPDNKKERQYPAEEAYLQAQQQKYRMKNLSLLLADSVAYNKFTKEPEVVEAPAPGKTLAAHF